MDHLDRAQLIAALTELLEAERAGALVGSGLVRSAKEPELRALAETIRHDEVHWCGMLGQSLRRLGAEPSAKVGAFYSKAEAIEDIGARLVFLNRGQAWVVRKLDELVPRVRGDELRADLKMMLDAHFANIERTEGVLKRQTAART